MQVSNDTELHPDIASTARENDIPLFLFRIFIILEILTRAFLMMAVWLVSNLPTISSVRNDRKPLPQRRQRIGRD